MRFPEREVAVNPAAVARVLATRPEVAFHLTKKFAARLFAEVIGRTDERGHVIV